LELNDPHLRRLRNQADFYSLFGAVAKLQESGTLPPSPEAAKRLGPFLEIVGDDKRRGNDKAASRYYEAARSASNDLRQRIDRIATMQRVLIERKA
jgi:hypothetical protein